MKLSCDVQLPASKSESNRALMIAAYGGFALDFQNLSESKDTQVLMQALIGLPFIDSFRFFSACHSSPLGERNLCREKLLNDIKSQQKCIDIADCGTAARFMTTYLACHDGEWLLTGNERMKQRPIRPLVDALLLLGADIQYVEKPGFLPLLIHGKPISGGKVAIDMSQSSQFVSSLLMAAPMWPQGLELELQGNLNSIPYLDMTLQMLCHFFAQVERRGHLIQVWPQPYRPVAFTVSADWSAASYWYELAALSEECEIRLRSLKYLAVNRHTSPATLVMSTDAGGSASMGDHSSLQGDSIIAEWMKPFGVTTTQESDSLILTKSSSYPQPLSFDCYNNPDLFPTLAATCAGLRREAHFSGIANLHFKESDRVEAMKLELAKIGVDLVKINDNELFLKPAQSLPFFEPSSPLLFASHGDHRIVMALAPLSLKLGSIVFDHPEVVAKSYPDFREKMGKMLPILKV